MLWGSMFCVSQCNFQSQVARMQLWAGRPLNAPCFITCCGCDVLWNGLWPCKGRGQSAVSMQYNWLLLRSRGHSSQALQRQQSVNELSQSPQAVRDRKQAASNAMLPGTFDSLRRIFGRKGSCVRTYDQVISHCRCMLALIGMGMLDPAPLSSCASASMCAKPGWYRSSPAYRPPMMQILVAMLCAVFYHIK